jgi:DNA-binding LytR/AlgR family response regulator
MKLKLHKNFGMNKIRILIVEDELIIAADMAGILSANNYNVVGKAKSYQEGLEALEIQQPDIVLLDIKINGNKDGVDLAHTIRNKYHIPFVFISSYTDRSTIERVKESNPYGFLVKPFDEEDLLVAVELSLNSFSKEQNNNNSLSEFVINESLFIRQKNLAIKVLYDDILYIEADSNYCNLFTQDKKYVIRSTLKDLENKLKPPKFFRTHKSYLVNLSRLTAINTNVIYVGNEKLPVGREQQAWLMEHLNRI